VDEVAANPHLHERQMILHADHVDEHGSARRRRTSGTCQRLIRDDLDQLLDAVGLKLAA